MQKVLTEYAYWVDQQNLANQAQNVAMRKYTHLQRSTYLTVYQENMMDIYLQQALQNEQAVIQAAEKANELVNEYRTQKSLYQLVDEPSSEPKRISNIQVPFNFLDFAQVNGSVRSFQGLFAGQR